MTDYKKAAKKASLEYAFRGVYSNDYPAELNSHSECTRDRYAPFYEGFIAGAKLVEDTKKEMQGEAVEFLKWATGGWDCPDYDHDPKWYGMHKGKDYNGISTEQLYTLFKESK